jgi:hypothetical protein
MSLKGYLFLMSLGTCFCWVAWVFVILNIAPADAGTTGMLFFYSSFFLAIVGTFSVLGFAIRQKLIKNEDAVMRHARHTFRQSIFVGLLAVSTLYLLASDLFAWWNFVLLVLLFLALEGIVFTKRKFNNVDYV